MKLAILRQSPQPGVQLGLRGDAEGPLGSKADSVPIPIYVIQTTAQHVRQVPEADLGPGHSTAHLCSISHQCSTLPHLRCYNDARDYVGGAGPYPHPIQ